MKNRHADDIAGTLEEMRAEYWRGIEQSQEAATEILDYVVVRLAGERFGIPSALTREVLRLPRLVRVPRVAGHIHGVFNLRGQIVAVTDLRPLFGLPAGSLPPGARLIVAEAAGLLTALVVEEVEGMLGIAADAVEPFTEGLSGFPREAVEGQVVDEQGLLMLLDLSRILARPEFVIEQKTE